MAWAHEDEPNQSSMLVLESISLIANRAPTDMVAEKIGDDRPATGVNYLG